MVMPVESNGGNGSGRTLNCLVRVEATARRDPFGWKVLSDWEPLDLFEGAGVKFCRVDQSSSCEQSDSRELCHLELGEGFIGQTQSLIVFDPL